MSIEVLLKKARQANMRLHTSIQSLQDPAISVALESLPNVINESLEHIQKLLTQEVLLKNTLQNEMLRIRKLIESKTGTIESKGNRFLEKIQAIELLGGIYNSYLALYEYYYPQPKQTPTARWQDDRLRLEQQVVYKEKGIDKALKKVLAALKKMAEEYFFIPNQCFISYAWADNLSDEKWVQPFLKYLETHLSQAGVNVSLDIKDNLMEDNLYQYMNRIKQSDCVIVVGTQALFQQHETSIGRVCNELILVNENRAQQQGKTLPILLSGCLDNALPPYFQMYNHVTDWRENSYITNLKRLLASIYNVGAENAEYQQLWKKFEQNYPILVAGFPEEAVHSQIALENELNSQQKELDAQQAMELFERANESQLNQLKMSNLSLVNSITITWETLIKCAKAKYMGGNQFNTVFGEAQEIAHCYVNLAIVEEKEQEEKYNKNIQGNEQLGKDKKSLKQVLERETWLNSYEEIHGAKTSISPQDIHKSQGGKAPHRQLILGRAGIGKSTLCQYLTYQWAKEEWWKDEPFKLLIWIPLCQLTNESIYPAKGSAITLGKLFYEQYKQPLKEYLVSGKERDWIHSLDKLIVEHSSEILYVLDGFDEVAHVCQLDGSQATRQTEILNQLLRQERSIITSRPYYIDNYLNTQGIKIDRRLENIGFVDKDVQNYIQLYSWKTTECQKELQSLVASNSLVRGIAHIPINLALLCRYWNTQTLKERHVISITDLYEGLVGNLLYEYLGKGKGYIDFVDSTTSSILNNKQAQPVLQFLEKLAFLQMQEESLRISKERIAGLLEECQGKVESNEWKRFKSVLGGAGLLVSPDEQEKCFEDRREHYFIHLTFQEFLAARYIARVFKQNEDSAGTVAWLAGSHQDRKISSQSLALFMQNHKYDLRYEITWWFVSGLLKEHREGIKRFFNSLCTEPGSLSGWYDFLLWIKCLEESKLTNNLNATLKKNLIEEIKKIALVALDGNVRISKWKYSKTFFEYLYSSPMVFEKLGMLQTQEAVKKVLDVLKRHLNLPISVLKKMVGLLRDKYVRNSALFALGKQSNLPSNILNEIAKLLRDEDENVRYSALYALSKQLNLPVSILNEMMRLLRDKEECVRCWALKALGQQLNLSDNILNEMAKLLRDQDENVRYSALSALGKQPNLSDNILDEMAKLLRDKNRHVRYSALSVLGKQPNLSSDILNEMVKLLRDKNGEVGSSVLDQQLNLSDSILNEMVKLLRDEEKCVRRSALEALGKQSNLSDNALNEMVKLLNDKDGDVRRSALKILGQQPNLSNSVLNKMVKLLKDKKGKVGSSVLDQQLNLSDSILNEMVKLLKNEEKSVRRWALEALGQQPNLSDNVLNEMVKLLNDKDGDVRRSALKILGQQPNLSDNILNKMVRLLRDKDEGVRHSALYALGQQPNLRVSILNEMERLLRGEKEEVRSSALLALGKQLNVPAGIVNEMGKLLRDESEYVRRLALDALSQQPNLSGSVLNEIVILLKNKDEYVRRSALDALSQQPNLSVSILNEIVTLLNDKKGIVRRSALKTLSKQWNVRGLGSALKALGKQSNLLANELFTLGQIQNDHTYKEEIDFINQQLALMSDNQVLQLRQFLNSKLLSDVILRNTFSSKGVAYFEGNQSSELLVMKLEQQIKKIMIRNKQEFISVFIERRELWLNNQNTSYLLTETTDLLSRCSIA